MDSADSASSPSPSAPVTLEAILQRHERMLVRLSENVAALTLAAAQRTPLPEPSPTSEPAQASSSSAVSAASPVLVPAVCESHLPTPELFSGDVGKCAGFLMQCSLQFRQRPHAFSNDGSKISYFVQLLRDRALTWAQAVLSASPEITYDEFLSLFRSVFDKGSTAAAAGLRLMNLKQGKRSMADFSVDFWTLATQAGWGQEALKTALLNNVSEEIKDELMVRELPPSLGAIMSLCIRIDDRLRARRSTQRRFAQPQPPRDASPGPGAAREHGEVEEEEQPMQLGRSQLSPTERQRRMAAGECLYCGRKGHFASSCRARAKGRARQ